MRRILLLVVLTVLVAPACGGDDADNAVVETLYGDGDINCPDHFAQDLSTPVGTVEYRPQADGVSVRVVLTDAAPDWEYNVLVIPEEGACGSWEGEKEFSGLSTDQDGAGVLELTFLTDPETYSLVVDVTNQMEVEAADQKLGEIAPGGFTEITVP